MPLGSTARNRLRGTFAVAVTEATPEGSLYEVTEGERLLFSATVRDRQIVGIPVFNLASDELEGVRIAACDAEAIQRGPLATKASRKRIRALIARTI